MSKKFCEMTQKMRMPRRAGRYFTVIILLGAGLFAGGVTVVGRGCTSSGSPWGAWLKQQCCCVLGSHSLCHGSGAQFWPCYFSTWFLTPESRVGWWARRSTEASLPRAHFSPFVKAVSSLVNVVLSASLSPVTLRNCGVSVFDVS